MSEPTKEQLQFAADLSNMTQQAGRLGLWRTMHRLHDAVREVGWELAGAPTPESQKKRMYGETDGVKQ